MKKILLVEDDPEIVMLFHLHFSLPDYVLTVCSKGKEAIDIAVNHYFDVIILDSALPDIDGKSVCSTLVRKNLNRPIIMLTTEPEFDSVDALEPGADSYVTKPFSVLKLQARIKALISRADRIQMAQTDCGLEVQAGELWINQEERRVRLQGRPLQLTNHEFDLLFLLASHPGKTFSRQELLQQVWGGPIPGSEHTITSHINQLRLKIEPDYHKPRHIVASRGVGYRFEE